MEEGKIVAGAIKNQVGFLTKIKSKDDGNFYKTRFFYLSTEGVLYLYKDFDDLNHLAAMHSSKPEEFSPDLPSAKSITLLNNVTISEIRFNSEMQQDCFEISGRDGQNVFRLWIFSLEKANNLDVLLQNFVKFCGTAVDQTPLRYSYDRHISTLATDDSIVSNNPNRSTEQLDLPNGNTYSGNLLNGQPYGTGMEFKPDGTYYKGEFRNGKWHGQGYLANSNLDGLYGEFIDGKTVGI
eukprot:CAMPEP_0115000018 /NCGR_PEP_ID=MMETSP0216-20121206/16499_1 /TAXON_ID=223996 /ORGANISM="Protocruzia adherens, Strain Boccale" /LENGTH=237 /DNA_ID=CAMNT_0002365019 /DNA_START=67 /DNA_END=780 /DNA_ORIENTATION=+